MRKFSIVGAALFAIIALGAVGVSAFADNTVWLCGGNPITGTGNNRCLTNSENLERFLFQDRNLPAEVECAVGAITDEGWVGPGSEDETTKVLFTQASCKKTATALNLKEEEVENKCITFTSILTVNLPWKTLIELVGGVPWDKILTAKAGYRITCTGITDTCEVQAGSEPSVLLENLALEGAEFPLVDAVFPKTLAELRTTGSNKELAKCSLGGAESGFVTGEELLAAITSAGAFQTLEFSTEP